MKPLDLEYFFILAGSFLLALAARIAFDNSHSRRWGSAIFWALLGVVFVAGRWLDAEIVGWAVVAMALLAGTGLVAPPAVRSREAPRHPAGHRTLGNRLLWPLLIVPAIAIVGSEVLSMNAIVAAEFVTAKQASQVALGLGSLVGLLLALRLTRERPITAIDEGGRLLQNIGWALLLPQVLVALGGVLLKAGVGDEVAHYVAWLLPVENPLVAVVAYCGGMAIFTMIFGNAFAAFPVITLGIGLPFIVKAHGGDPAIMATLGMLSGYCGTLLTPMAANFNIVPVRLLELSDDYAVIKAQAPFAAAIWLFNVAVMYLFVYPA
ncbi:MAG: DUF979 domain-containing protein [Planctomycetota bacterium]